MSRVHSAYYSVEGAKLDQVVARVLAAYPDGDEHEGVIVARAREFALADWPEGQEHQQWLDTASIEEIADWIVAGIA